MKSESLFYECNKCSKRINKAERRCPNCGAFHLRIKIWQWLFLSLLGLWLLGLLFGSGNTDQGDDGVTHIVKVETQSSRVSLRDVEVSRQQHKFISVLADSRQGYESAKNELVRSKILRERDTAIAQSTYSGIEWIGKIVALDTTEEGHATLSVEIAPSVFIATWNNSLSDIGDATLIRTNTSLYADLSNLSVGENVSFTGEFLRTGEGFIREQSITQRGSVIEPEFLFRFNTVEPLQ